MSSGRETGREGVDHSSSFAGLRTVALPQFILIFYSVLKSLAFVSTEFTTAKQDVDEMYREAPIKGGLFDYVEFTRILKHGANEKDEQ